MTALDDAVAVWVPAGAGVTASVGVAVRSAAARLARSGSETPRLDAEVLVAHALDRDRAWLLAHPDADLAGDAAARLARFVERRATGEPVAYIRGFKDWFSLRIRTDARALIPRPETELLAETAIAEIAARLTTGSLEERVVTWDLGTGSGCLAVAIGLRFRTAIALGRVRVIASDASEAALALARENVSVHGLDRMVQLLAADLLPPASGEAPAAAPDVVVANLPYVPTGDIPRLPVAASFEPRLALDGGADGVDVMRALLADLPQRLRPGGVALLELGDGQIDAVREAATSAGLLVTQTVRDLEGVERVVRLVPGAAGEG